MSRLVSLDLRRPTSAGLYCVTLVYRPDVGMAASVRFADMGVAIGIAAMTVLSGDRGTLTDAFRVGHGYDFHRLAIRGDAGAGLSGGQPVRPFVLGGVRFESDRGPVAHSDGDALLHAITDGILGALGLPDIGELFPDNEPRWDGVGSEVFLAEAVRLMKGRGFAVGNVDATVILERPKLAGRKAEVRASVARLLGVEVGRVNVKGKTHEGVDAVGEGRAVEVHAVVLLCRERTAESAEVAERGAGAKLMGL